MKQHIDIIIEHNHCAVSKICRPTDMWEGNFLALAKVCALQVLSIYGCFSYLQVAITFTCLRKLLQLFNKFCFMDQKASFVNPFEKGVSTQ